jgi:hypothetical protein
MDFDSYTEKKPAPNKGKGRSQNQALRELKKLMNGNGSAKLSEWKQECKNSGMERTTTNKLIKSLTEAGIIKVSGERVSLLD